MENNSYRQSKLSLNRQFEQCIQGRILMRNMILYSKLKIPLHATGDESVDTMKTRDKMKGVDNSNGKDRTMVAHKKYSRIRIGWISNSC